MNWQLAIDADIGELLKKLSEANSDRSALAKRFAETKNTLKGTEAALEEVRDRLEGEKVETVVLQSSLNKLKDG